VGVYIHTLSRGGNPHKLSVKYPHLQSVPKVSKFENIIGFPRSGFRLRVQVKSLEFRGHGLSMYVHMYVCVCVCVGGGDGGIVKDENRVYLYSMFL